MSSIAYVTDEKMLEYHRLCCNSSILFWRLTTKNRFTDFKEGDLLFFYARDTKVRSRKKAFIGYGHYSGTKRLSLHQMWKQYSTKTGYDSFKDLQEAISKASKGEIPKTMLCLELDRIVFFMSPVYPSEVGLSIPLQLESYYYLDQEDPSITSKILKCAAKYGVDIWTQNTNETPEDIFLQDEIKHILSTSAYVLKEQKLTDKEKPVANRISLQQVSLPDWEYIRNSKYECMHVTKDKIDIAIPFTCNTLNRQERIVQLLGRMTYYKIQLMNSGITLPVHFKVLHENEEPEIKKLVKVVNELVKE